MMFWNSSKFIIIGGEPMQSDLPSRGRRGASPVKIRIANMVLHRSDSCVRIIDGSPK
jgi:hypothetical protein